MKKKTNTYPVNEVELPWIMFYVFFTDAPGVGLRSMYVQVLQYLLPLLCTVGG